MMLKILFSLTMLSNIALYAEEVPYTIDIVRNGKVHHQVAYNFWSGEYPEPVINVHAGKSGKTTINGYTSLRNKKERKVCTIKNGLYHPWSKDENSYIHFYTIVPVESYEILSTPSSEIQKEIEGTNLKAGDKILNIVYLGEGYSEGILHSNAIEDTLVSFQSQIFENNPKIFKKIKETNTANITEQWLYLKCDEKYNIFVEDKDILSQKGIKRGEVTGYGEISK